MKIYVGGVNGVGKTTITQEAAKILGMECIRGSYALMEYLGFGHDYTKLRALTQKQRDIANRECSEFLLNSKDNFIMDGHYLGLVHGKVDRVTDSWINGYDALILIEAPFEDVWDRIAADEKTRDRALFPTSHDEDNKKTMLKNYIDQTREEFTRIAELYKKPHIIIQNDHGKQNVAIQAFVDFVRKNGSSPKSVV